MDLNFKGAGRNKLYGCCIGVVKFTILKNEFIVVSYCTSLNNIKTVIIVLYMYSSRAAYYDGHAGPKAL